MTVNVSDHALVRWLERQYGMDMEGYRQELAGLVEPYVAIKAKSACVGPGLWAVIGGVDGNVVTTVVPGERPPPAPMRAYSGGHVPEKLNWKALKRKRSHK